MTETASYASIQNLAVDERIKYYEQELSRLNQPATFREKVLVNVYRCLLQGCVRQSDSKARLAG